MDSVTVLVAAGSDVYVLVAEGVPGNAVPAGVRVLDGVPITGVGVSVLTSNGSVGTAFFEQPAAIKTNNTHINAPTDRIFFTFTSIKSYFLFINAVCLCAVWPIFIYSTIVRPFPLQKS